MAAKGTLPKRYSPAVGAASSGVSARAKPLTPFQEKTLNALLARKEAASGSTTTAVIGRTISDPVSPSERFWNHLVGEGGVIRGAPAIFFSLLGAMTVGMFICLWVVLNWAYDSRYQSQQTQIQMLELQRDNALSELAKANDQLREFEKRK